MEHLNCLGKWLLVLLLSVLFKCECSLTLSLKKQLMRVLNLYMTALHCIQGEISPLHTHLQWAHLLIRPDPGDWLGPLFSVHTVEIRLSFLLNRQTLIYIHTHTHLRIHTPVRTVAQTHIFIMPLLQLIGGLLCDVSTQSFLSFLAAWHFCSSLGTEGLKEVMEPKWHANSKDVIKTSHQIYKLGFLYSGSCIQLSAVVDWHEQPCKEMCLFSRRVSTAAL